MPKRSPHRDLLQIVGAGWLAFLVAGWLLSRFLAAPAIAVLIDQSYCPPTQWQQVAQIYNDLYQQHQQQALTIEQVIVFSDLGEETLTPLPKPEAVRTLRTYGRPDPERQKALQAAYANARLLSCSEANSID